MAVAQLDFHALQVTNVSNRKLDSAVVEEILQNAAQVQMGHKHKQPTNQPNKP